MTKGKIFILIIVIGIGITFLAFAGFYIKNYKPSFVNLNQNPSVSQNDSTNQNITSIIKPSYTLPVIISELEKQYNITADHHYLKYKTYAEAVHAFQLASSDKMLPTQISFYVPGKVPHEDGNPYFIGRGTIDEGKNECIVGYMNLVTGVVESHKDVCVIYG